MKTYGCQMNFHDSERIAGMFIEQGYELADDPSQADVVLVNTCAVREKPERKLFAELGRYRRLKKLNPDLVVGVTGCMAPRDGDVIRSRAPYVDVLVGPRSLHRLPDLVRQVRLHRLPVEDVGLMEDPTSVTPVRRTSTVCAWVDVMFGCSYKCTFCAVPSARGPERSRPPADILAEVAELAALGYREVTLLGQTVNAYGRDVRYRFDGSSRVRQDFAWLLEEIDRRHPHLRVRFTSPHPQLFTARLIDAIARLSTVCEHVHLPLQSGDDEILRRMNRTYTVARFRQMVEQLRLRIPEVSITTDIIVGFPGESETQFEATLRAVEEFRFDGAFMFAYSPRRHTAALQLDGAVPRVVAFTRLQRLIEVVNRQAQRLNEAEVGRTVEVLVEGPAEKSPTRLAGRTRRNKVVVLDGPRELIGKPVEVKLLKAFRWGFEGKVSA